LRIGPLPDSLASARVRAGALLTGVLFDLIGEEARRRASQEHAMICPKCGREQPEAPECERCGIVVARYRQHAAGASGGAGVERPEPRLADGSRRSGLVEWLILAAALSLVTVWVVQRDRARPTSEALLQRVARKAEVPRSQPELTVAKPTPPSVTIAAGPPMADPTPSGPPDVLPTATCPLSDHGFGAPPVRGRVSSDWYTNPSDLERARGEQESAVAPLVVYVYTDWCPYCRAFERGLLTSSVVDEYLRDNAVKLRVNPETSREAAALAERFGANRYPTFVLACIPGDRPEAISIYRKGNQLKSPGEFISEIEARVVMQAFKLVDAGRRARTAGQLPESVKLLTMAIRMKAGDQAYFERALSLAQSGATDEAIDDIARVARDRPNEILAYQAADSLLGQLGRWDEVIACWTGVLERNASSSKAYLARALALERKGLRGLSQTDFEKACALGEPGGCRRRATALVRASS
jgi:thiol-disulfide isomerase/thioredoxin